MLPTGDNNASKICIIGVCDTDEVYHYYVCSAKECFIGVVDTSEA